MTINAQRIVDNEDLRLMRTGRPRGCRSCARVVATVASVLTTMRAVISRNWGCRHRRTRNVAGRTGFGGVLRDPGIAVIPGPCCRVASGTGDPRIRLIGAFKMPQGHPSRCHSRITGGFVTVLTIGAGLI